MLQMFGRVFSTNALSIFPANIEQYWLYLLPILRQHWPNIFCQCSANQNLNIEIILPCIKNYDTHLYFLMKIFLISFWKFKFELILVDCIKYWNIDWKLESKIDRILESYIDRILEMFVFSRAVYIRLSIFFVLSVQIYILYVDFGLVNRKS